MNEKINFLKRIDEIGFSFSKFCKGVDEHAKKSSEGIIDEHEKMLHALTRLNQRRSTRIVKSYKISEEAARIIKQIQTPQTWLIITEDWCGDSAQNLPHLYRLSELNSNIELKIIYRDENLDIIDRYLTNGGRAIPKVIGLDGEGNELFQWGPRPAVAQQFVKEWKESGLKPKEYNEKLHLWYGRDRGKTFEKEFVGLFQKKQ